MDVLEVPGVVVLADAGGAGLVRRLLLEPFSGVALGDAFLDFSENARKAANELDFDFERMRTAAGSLYDRLQHIRNEDLVLNACKTKNLTGHRATPKAIVEVPAVVPEPVAKRPAEPISIGRPAKQKHTAQGSEISIRVSVE